MSFLYILNTVRHDNMGQNDIKKKSQVLKYEYVFFFFSFVSLMQSAPHCHLFYSVS